MMENENGSGRIEWLFLTITVLDSWFFCQT
jgi:hypothetical protein